MACRLFHFVPQLLLSSAFPFKTKHHNMCLPPQNCLCRRYTTVRHERAATWADVPRREHCPVCRNGHFCVLLGTIRRPKTDARAHEGQDARRLSSARAETITQQSGRSRCDTLTPARCEERWGRRKGGGALSQGYF